jgi:hypothetical protein
MTIIAFQGTVNYLTNNRYAALIFPLVQLQKLFKKVYNFVLRLIWNELIYGKKVENELAAFLTFIAFCLLSWLVYIWRDYLSFILTSSLIIWCLDYWLAKHQYLKKKNNVSVILKQEAEDSVTWMMQFPDAKSLDSTFINGKIREISISNRPIYGGAFQEIMGRVWQIELILYDGSDLVIDEQQSVVEAVKKAKRIAKYFNVPIVFEASQGSGQYAADRLNKDLLDLGGIKCQKSQPKWHICSRWRWINSWFLLKQISQESGFLFFVLIMSGLMVRFGQLVQAAISLFLGNPVSVIDLSGIFLGFNSSFSWQQKVGLAIAIAMMVFKGWQLSREKHIYLDKYYLKFAIDNQKIDRLKTQEIETALLLYNPEPELLILAHDRAIVIPKFQREEDCKALLYQVEQGIQAFKDH